MSKKTRRKSKDIMVRSLVPDDVKTEDKTPIVYQKNKLRSPLTIFHRPLTSNQEKFLELATRKDVSMLIASGPAGTAKTYLAVQAALELLHSKKDSDIVYIRSIVESSDAKMGFLPGEKEDKMSPYMQPLMDKLDELLPKNDIKMLQSENRIECFPVGYLRGLNWNAKVIVADEMQNCSKKEIVTIMTRVGEFSKIFMIGDPTQSDINGRSGFKAMFELFNSQDSRDHGIYTIEFTEEDIVRSQLVRFITNKIKNVV